MAAAAARPGPRLRGAAAATVVSLALLTGCGGASTVGGYDSDFARVSSDFRASADRAAAALGSRELPVRLAALSNLSRASASAADALGRLHAPARAAGANAGLASRLRVFALDVRALARVLARRDAAASRAAGGRLRADEAAIQAAVGRLAALLAHP